MQTTFRYLASLSVLSLMLFATSASADDSEKASVTTTSTATTATGTISEVGPETIFVTTTTSADPVRFSYTTDTTYVDEDDNPVSMEIVRSGLPVTVHYDMSGTKMVATKVVVKKTVVVPTS